MNASDNLGRTAMLASELTSRGHETLWWTSSFDHQRKRSVLADDETVSLRPGLSVRGIGGIGYRGNFSVRRYVDHLVVAARFRARAPRLPRPDVIVAATPDHHLAWEAVAFARARGIPVIVDVRDRWPESFVDYFPAPLRPFLKAGLWLDSRTLRRALAGASSITSVNSDWLAWGLANAGRARTRRDDVFFIGGRRPRPAAQLTIPDHLRSKLASVSHKFVVTFVGQANRTVDPSLVIEAAGLLERGQVGDELAVLVAGNGPGFVRARERAAGMKNVHMLGWLNRDESDAVLAVSSVAVLPTTVPTATFPNRAFAFLGAGLPLLSSADGDLARLLAEYNAGHTFRRGDRRQLADLIAGLARDPSSRNQMADNARQLFEALLEADPIYARFADHVERIASESTLGDGFPPSDWPGD